MKKFAMKKTVLKNAVSCLSILLLFTLTPAEANGEDVPFPGVIGVIDVPSHPLQDIPSIPAPIFDPVQRAEPTDRQRRAAEPHVLMPLDPFFLQEQAWQDFQRTVHILQGLSQRLQRTSPYDPLVREFQRAIGELQAVGQRLQRTAAVTPPPPFAVRRVAPPPAPTTQMEIAREQAYIALARQYFFVLSSTPVEPPVTLRSMAMAGLQQQAQQQQVQQQAQPPTPLQPSMGEMRVIGEDGREFVVIDGAAATETISEAEEWAQRRGEMRDNFVECIQKISPMARITLISELIRSSHTSEELRLLEGLLDDIVMPSTEQPAGTGRASGQAPTLPPPFTIFPPE